MSKSQSYLLDDQVKAKDESLRLRVQAQKLFELEFPTLKQHGLLNPGCIMDIGCGNGSYLELLRGPFPKSSLVGVDRNSTLLGELERSVAEIKTRKLDLTDRECLRTVLNDFDPDFLISRYVLQHLSAHDTELFFEGLKAERKPSRRLLLIDTNDLEIRFDPHCESLQKLRELKFEKQAKLGGDRTIGSRLAQILEQHGFTDIRHTKLEFTHENLGWESWISIFWPILRSGLPDKVREAEANLVNKSKEWLEQATRNSNYHAAWTVHYVSGK